MKAIITYKIDCFSAYYNLPLLDCNLIENYTYKGKSKIPILYIQYFEDNVTVQQILDAKSVLEVMFSNKLTIDQINKINLEFFNMLDHPEIEEKIIEI